MAIVLIWSRYISRLLLVTPISFKRSHFSTFTGQTKLLSGVCLPTHPPATQPTDRPSTTSQFNAKAQRQWRVFVIDISDAGVLVLIASIMAFSAPMLPVLLTPTRCYLCRGMQLMNEQKRSTQDSRRLCHSVHHPVCLFTALWVGMCVAVCCWSHYLTVAVASVATTAAWTLLCAANHDVPSPVPPGIAPA